MGNLQTLEAVYHDERVDEYYLDKHSGLYVVKDSSGFVYFVPYWVQDRYHDYLVSGVIPRDDLDLDIDLAEESDEYYWDYYTEAHYLDEPWCRHGGHGLGDCVTCDMEAYEDHLDGLFVPADEPALADPFARQRAAHERRKVREAARRAKTLLHHRRDHHSAPIVMRRLAGVKETTFKKKREKRFAEKPWQARYFQYWDVLGQSASNRKYRACRSGGSGEKYFRYIPSWR